MSIKNGETDYKLKRPFNYSDQGQTTQAEYVLLREPSFEHQDEYFQLQKYVTQAQMSMALISQKMGVLDTSDEPDISGQEVQPFHEQVEEIEASLQDAETSISMSIKMSDNVNTSEFVRTFQKIATKKSSRKPIALVDGNLAVSLNKTLWERLHLDDMFGMAVRWCAFFVIAVDAPQNSSSKKPYESASPPKEV